MAYASKELKDKINALVKEVAKEMNVKLGVSLKREHCSKIYLNIRSCSIDLVKEHRDFLESQMAYYNENPGLKEGRKYDRIACLYNSAMRGDIRFSKDNPEEVFSGKALELLEKIRDAVKCDYYNNSDYMQDYFDVAYYYDISIGNSDSGFKAV